MIEKVDISSNLTALEDDLYINLKNAVPAEFKSSINAYLSDLLYSPVRSLAEIVAFNNAHPTEVRSNLFELAFNNSS